MLLRNNPQIIHFVTPKDINCKFVAFGKESKMRKMVKQSSMQVSMTIDNLLIFNVSHPLFFTTQIIQNI